MKNLLPLLLCLSLPLFSQDPPLPPKTKLIDFYKSYTNFTDLHCPYCQTNDSGKAVEDLLHQAGFEKKPNVFHSRIGHCFGASVLFVKTLLEQPELFSKNCQEIVTEIFFSINAREQMHSYSINQMKDYLLPIEFQDSRSHSFYPIGENSRAAKAYYEALIEHPVSRYLFTTLQDRDPKHFVFEQEALLRILQQMPNQAAIIGFQCKDGARHVAALCTHPTKLLVYDADSGLFQFTDLESMSEVIAKVWKDYRFMQAVMFPLPENP